MEVKTMNIHFASRMCVAIKWPCSRPTAMHCFSIFFDEGSMETFDQKRNVSNIVKRWKTNAPTGISAGGGGEEKHREIKWTRLRAAQGQWGHTLVSLSLCLSLRLASPSDSKWHSEPLHYSVALQLPFYQITQRRPRDGTRRHSLQM